MADAWLSSVWPRDAAVALRSYPRRFRALLASLDEDERPDDLAHRAGAGGRSALDHAADVAATCRLVADAVRRVLTADRPEVPAEAASGEARSSPAVGGSRTTEGVLADLATAAQALADVAEGAPADDWRRTGVVAGRGTEVSALDLLREAVRTGHVRLRDAQQVLSEVRGRPVDLE